MVLIGLILIGTIAFVPPIVLFIFAKFLWRMCNKKFHLSTALILVVVIGILLGANLSKHDSELEGQTFDNKKVKLKTYSYGFPFSVNNFVYAESIALVTDKQELEELLSNFRYRYQRNGDVRLSYDLPFYGFAAIFNVEIGIALILLVAYLSEARIQHIL
jgi:hypothetical protein